MSALKPMQIREVSRLTIALQQAAQSTAEFAAAMQSIKDRYHPLVRWLFLCARKG